MAITAKSPIAPYWYTPKVEKDNGNPTRFKMRGLSGIEGQDVQLHNDQRGVLRSNATSVKTVLGYALQDWENVIDEKGEAVPFNRENKAESIGRLSAEIVAELFWEAITNSSLNEDQEKN